MSGTLASNLDSLRETVLFQYKLVPIFAKVSKIKASGKCNNVDKVSQKINP